MKHPGGGGGGGGGEGGGDWFLVRFKNCYQIFLLGNIPFQGAFGEI